MDIAQIRAFDAVARTGSFSLAAKELRVQQPAVSKAIAHLERSLGVPLFERRARGVVVTAVGARLEAHAARVLTEVRAMQLAPEDDRATPHGEVVLATSDHVAVHLLPTALAELARTAPGIVPRVRTGAATESVQGLLSGTVDLGLFFKMERDPRLERRTVGWAACQLVVAPEARRDPAVLGRFIGSREVDDPSNKSFPTLAMLRKKRPDTAITLSCTSLEAHKAFVRAGLGVSILPRFVCERELREGSLVVLEPRYVYRATLELVVARGRTLSRAARTASHLVRRAMETHRLLEHGTPGRFSGTRA